MLIKHKIPCQNNQVTVFHFFNDLTVNHKLITVSGYRSITLLY